MNNPLLIPISIICAILVFLCVLVMLLPPIPLTKNKMPLDMQNYGTDAQSKDNQDFYFGLIDSVVHIFQDTWNVTADDLKDHCDYRPTSYGTVVEILLPHYQFRFYFKWAANALDISMITKGAQDNIITTKRSFRDFSLNYELIYTYFHELYINYGSQHYLDAIMHFKTPDDLTAQVIQAAAMVPDDKILALYEAYKEDAAKYGISRKELSLLIMLSKFLDKPLENNYNDKEEVNE